MNFRQVRGLFWILCWKLMKQITHKTRSKCDNCETMRQINDHLERELIRTNKELEEAKAKLKKIKHISLTIAKSTTSEMTAGNVPKGRYSFLLGQNDLANRILPILGLKKHTPRKKFKLLGGWLGRL